jgi:hypothetical protein
MGLRKSRQGYQDRNIRMNEGVCPQTPSERGVPLSSPLSCSHGGFDPLQPPKSGRERIHQGRMGKSGLMNERIIRMEKGHQE